MKVQAHLKNYRKSPRKVRSVAQTLQGLNALEAMNRLRFCTRGSSDALIGLIASAIANAENNFSMKKDNLFISEITVNEGTKLKRWMPRAQGRATRILKRISCISVFLEEKEIKGMEKKDKNKKVSAIKTKELKESSKKEEKVVKKTAVIKNKNEKVVKENLTKVEKRSKKASKSDK
ncbi:MAG: 50S ribosomal protein L22 [Candidatus Moranbacteria bacterium]|nr:50S ribosomal protein L22 [Candidatus Moranbacteria bacterium]